MELELGLALPSGNTIKSPVLDLNSYSHEPRDVLGPHAQFSTGSSSITDVDGSKRRRIGDAFGETTGLPLPRTLPLLLWDNQRPNDEDDDHKDTDNNDSAFNKVDRERDDGVVGWPPVRFWKKKKKKQLCLQKNQNRSQGIGNGHAYLHVRPLNSMYVKVHMEGQAIARKIDISRFNSFRTLKCALLLMFDKRQEDINSYKLTYQDKEGDWFFAGDLPWRTFVGSVQRLKLVRSSSKLVLGGRICVPCCSSSSGFNIWEREGDPSPPL